MIDCFGLFAFVLVCLRCLLFGLLSDRLIVIVGGLYSLFCGCFSARLTLKFGLFVFVLCFGTLASLFCLLITVGDWLLICCLLFCLLF